MTQEEMLKKLREQEEQKRQASLDKAAKANTAGAMNASQQADESAGPKTPEPFKPSSSDPYIAASETAAHEMKVNAARTAGQYKDMGKQAEANARVNVAEAKGRQEMLVGQLNKANAELEGSFADRILDIKNQHDKEKEESEAREASQRKTARWTAAGELAVAMANLFGVANGASNQTSKSYSQDWMAAADAERDKRKARLDNIRERQAQLESQLAALKSGNASNMAELQYKNAEQVAAIEAEGRSAAEKYNQAAVGAENEGNEAAAKIMLSGKDASIKSREDSRQFNKRMELEESKAAASATKKDDSYPVSFKAADGKRVTVKVDYNSWKAVFETTGYQDLEGELTDDEFKRLKSAAMGKDAEKQSDIVKQYLDKSPTLQEKLMAVSRLASTEQAEPSSFDFESYLKGQVQPNRSNFVEKQE